MARPEPITTRPGKKPGEFVVSLPSGWDLRLRRVLSEVNIETLALPNPRERGLTPAQREARARLRRRRMRAAFCRYISELLTADIVGKEVALSGRGRYGIRRGSLREHIQFLLGTASEK